MAEMRRALECMMALMLLLLPLRIDDLHSEKSGFSELSVYRA